MSGLAAQQTTEGAAATWADLLAADVAAIDPGGPIVCASGISPSGPIHMGNLREVLTTHFVVEALRASGVDAVHLHSWDDYDRLRKVPEGVHPSFEEHIGKPLATVPDPFGDLSSYAERFIAEFDREMTTLGVAVEGRRQSALYPAGTYNAAIRRAMDDRSRIFDILASQQTPGRQTEPLDQRRSQYYPFVVYCTRCGTDATRVTKWDGRHADWLCRCGENGRMDLADGCEISGKLVWKVDWPMRWRHESVRFEPAGEDHHAPTGSFTVGRQIVADVYGGRAPHSTVYSFVQLAGQGGKMSGSKGRVAVPQDALDVIEPAIVRWLYIRRLPSQSFAIDLTPRGVQQLYDEWDRFVDRAAAESETVPARLLTASRQSSSGRVPATERRVSFRLLASVADITQGNLEQIGRIVAAHLTANMDPDGLLRDLEPRLTCAIHYASELVPVEDRTVVREHFAADVWDEFDDGTREGLAFLVDGLADHWTVEGLTDLLYGVPKRMLGLAADAEPTVELKQAQRAFFRVLYQLLAGRDTGPRLPTFLLSIGRERARQLLDGWAVQEL